MKPSATIKKIIKKIISYDSLRSRKIKKSSSAEKYNISRYNRYTVVSAIYNVEKYLEAYFKSFIIQSLGFEEHIHLILVDDGSTDNSAEIIKKWQERFPNNITYIQKENGGQASARNLGIDYAKNEWITFVDPDDFLDYRYFEEVDSFLEKNTKKNIGLVSCNTLFYNESDQQIKDTHALNYRFMEEETIVCPSDMKGYIQLSASSAFFRKSLLEKSHLHFSETIRPNFEDAHLVNRYFIQNSDISVVFLQKAKYLYRKREDGTSTLDTSWKSVDRYENVIKNGYLDILKYAQSRQRKVPLYLQRTILYDLMWHFKLFLNNSHKLGHLTSKQRKNYLTLIEEIFNYIDMDTIEDFELAGVRLSDKIGLMGRFKKSEPPYYLCHVDDYDKAKHEIRLRYFYYYSCEENFLLDGKSSKTHFDKIRIYDFAGEIFLYEKILWLPLDQSSQFFNAQLGNRETRIDFAGIQYNHEYDILTIINHFEGKNGIDQNGLPDEYRFYRAIYQNSSYDKLNNAWLLKDRDNQADDNAEHLYRYISNHHKKINQFFLLRKTSHDWDRLKKEGFKLIELGSEEHAITLLKADHLISSHADPSTTDYLPKRWFSDIIKSKFTFLQHGIIKDDLSNWLNSKEINCFITTSPAECNSISGDFNRYKFTKKEVILTGLPRHDALLSGANKLEKLILIMPTWRESAVDKTRGAGGNRVFNNAFGQTAFAKHWKSFLQSKQLKKLSQKYHYHIAFFPHANMQPYLDIFNAPDYIETFPHGSSSIQALFQRASIMITDYSSVALEMGILNKGTIYYQFDFDEVFSGGHTYQNGYYNYENDGFGPICHKEEEVLNELEKSLKAECKVDSKYLKRMEDFFAFHDTDNCRRVFETIRNLDKPYNGT